MFMVKAGQKNFSDTFALFITGESPGTLPHCNQASS